MCKVTKRDGRIVEFDDTKIKRAILKAFEEVDGGVSSFAMITADTIAQNIKDASYTKNFSIEEIQDLVENGLMETDRKDVAKAYIIYRNKRSMARGNTIDSTVEEYLDFKNEYWKYENSNKDSVLVTTQRDYLAGILSTDMSRRLLLPHDVVEAHDEGIIHFHDIDYFLQNALHNCDLINLEDMLQNGTVINGVKIEKPHKFSTACTIATQIILGVSSSQYGGCTISLTHLAPFVRSSFDKFKKKYIDNGLSEEDATRLAEIDTKIDIADGVQTFNYQVNSMSNSNGQAPFLSVFMYLGETTEYKKELALIIEEFFKQRIQGFKNEKGVWVTPAFPKLLYTLEPDNLEGGPYYELTKLAAKCTAKRMVPDYISEKKMLELKGDVYPPMGCRSFLTPDRFTPEGQTHKYYGRFNCGVVTINLVDVACSSNKDMDKFWDILDERLELCHKALQYRIKRLEGTPSDVAPILWQYGALARLKKGETIDKLLRGGYATISLGYAGIYEMTRYMTGKSHTEEGGKEFALSVMKKMNDKCNQWKHDEDIDYSVYGTPIESTTYKFAKNLQRRFGIIEGVTDHSYIINSYHCNIREHINAFDKLTFESEFQALSPGGAVSYVEVPDLQNNIDVVLSIINHIYETIIYAELNSKSDNCLECGFSGEIEIIEDENGQHWECPCCHNTDEKKMYVARRTCGLTTTI